MARVKQTARKSIGGKAFPYLFYQHLIDVKEPQPLLMLLLKLLLVMVNWELLLVIYWEV
jgi:hypothetical protein